MKINMKVFVISLSHAKARREHMSQELAKQDINFCFFDAISGYSAQEKINELGLSYLPSALSPGELGCAMSHISLWLKLIESQDEAMVVLEDDIFLGKDAAFFIKDCDWVVRPVADQLVKLEKYQDKILIGRANTQIKGRSLHPLLGDHWGTAGYLIGRGVALKMLAFLADHPLRQPIDHFMFDTYRQVYPRAVWQLNPAICIQEVVHQQKNGLGSDLAIEREARQATEILIDREVKSFWMKQARLFTIDYWRYKLKKVFFLREIKFM